MASIGAPPSSVAAFNEADAKGQTGRLPDVSASASLGANMPRATVSDDDDALTETGDVEEEDPYDLDLQPLSDLDVVSLPPGLIRLLSTLRPFIAALNAGARLATWTAGPHSAPLSILLVLGWWATCRFTYPLFRYAPQLLVLGTIGWYYLKAHWSPFRTSSQTKQIGDVMGNERVIIAGSKDDQVLPVDNAATLTTTVAQLEELADFVGTVHTRLIRPCRRAIDWSNPQATLTLAVFLIVTYPVYLACVLPWSQLGIPRLALVFVPHGTGALGAVGLALHWVYRHVVEIVFYVGSEAVRRVSRYPSGAQYVLQAQAVHQVIAQRWFTIQPYLYLLGRQGIKISRSVAFRVLYSARGKDALAISVAPPFPLFSLDVSTILFIIGAIALTWCSPLFVLIRHAVWSSALLRYATRSVAKAITLGYWEDNSGDSDMKYYSLRDVFSKRVYNAAGPLDVSSSVANELAGSERRDLFDLGDEQPSPILGPALPDDILQNITSRDGSKEVEEFRNIVYQFSIFENQRWWVGLDWTAALLPQERASWTDEHNVATLPPPSFTLPAAKIQLNPIKDGNVYIKRLSRWQWVDQEWVIAGTSYISAMPQYAQIGSGTEDDNSTLSGSVARGFGSQAAALAGSLSDSLRNRLTATNVLALSTFGADAPTTTPDILEVDSEGWQYGGNSWENMSPLAGMGKYTRRRKWVRRAVLVEIVQRDYVPSEAEKASLDKQKA